jgi:hypothetical protein
MSYTYIIYTFELQNVIETEDWINKKSSNGFKIINIHYHTINGKEYVRYTLEK